MYRLTFTDLMTLEMAGRFSETGGWTHSGRMLDRSILCYIEEGSCSFLIGENRIELNAGEAVIIPENTFYAPHTQSGCLYQYFHFRALVEETDEPAPLSRSYRYSEQIQAEPAVFFLPPSFTVDSAVRFSFETILSELSLLDPLSKVRMNLAFFDALTRIADRCGSHPDRTLACAIENHILENLSHQPTLSTLSARFGYTRQYIIRVFKRQFHTTPAAYINDVRLSRAIRYLAEGSISIEEVARRCGFEDANYFSRLFKRKYGLTPSDYRRQSTGI